MKWFVLVCGMLTGLVICHVYQEVVMKSQHYWENVGPNTDKALNPSKYNQDEVK